MQEDVSKLSVTNFESAGLRAAARCKMRLVSRQDDGKAFEFQRFIKKGIANDIEVKIALHMNEQSKVDCVNIEKWHLNGEYFPAKLQLWPEITLSDDRACIRSKFRQWGEDIQDFESEDQGSLIELLPTRRDVLNSLAIQAIILFFGKGEIDRAARENEIFMERKDSFPAMESLRADIANVLVREPNWKYYTKDFSLVDQTGITIPGQDQNKRFLKLLRNLNDGLLLTPLKATLVTDTETFYLKKADGTRDPVLQGSWVVEINYRSRIPYDLATSIESNFLAKVKPEILEGKPFKVAGKACFRFDDDRQVRLVKIDSWSINDKEVFFFDSASILRRFGLNDPRLDSLIANLERELFSLEREEPQKDVPEVANTTKK